MDFERRGTFSVGIFMTCVVYLQLTDLVGWVKIVLVRVRNYLGWEIL